MVNSDLISRIEYSEKYNDENYEYRHVIMPGGARWSLPRSALMSEQEWRNAGIQMSRGWQHFDPPPGAPHLLVPTRAPLEGPLSGKVDPRLGGRRRTRRRTYLEDNTNVEA
ncbi:cyclin-dependent protein serine/threonine kinase activator [Aureococcus anophagefferens]|uniref:Cyclin-dependent kinases regulatory subunit n=1 Tax=Aureococcus anophagefferens TaxID=44056 RepID=A0ABR1FNK3_AURAN